MGNSQADKIFVLAARDALQAAHCNGCAVCALSCPVWLQTHDQFLTFSGRMRAIQGGATPQDISASLRACVLCGSCEPVCSYGMDTVAKTIEMLSTLTADKVSGPPAQSGSAPGARGRVALLNSLITDNAAIRDKVMQSLGTGVDVYGDNGQDISLALEGVGTVDPGRVGEFINNLKGAAGIVTTDGLLYRLIKRLLPGAGLSGIGEELLKLPEFRRQLYPDDLYVIDTRTYHADFKRLVVFYDELRKETGCMMNLDLHRVATPTGASLARRGAGVVDPLKQARWILKGRDAARIIVEKIEDMEPFRKASDLPVLFIGEME